jgi:hypothetical protein
MVGNGPKTTFADLKLLAGEGISAQSIAKSLKRTIPAVLRKAQRVKLTLAWRPKAKWK